MLALTACGGGHKGSSTTTGLTTIERQTIVNNWEKFFSSKTALPGRVALLENGSKFKSVVQSFASNPLASNVSSLVSSVRLVNANKARIVYTVKISGASLGKQTGYAVRQNGVWKVGDASLCKLIALGGTTPAVCKKP
jgi:hypothetical protein